MGNFYRAGAAYGPVSIRIYVDGSGGDNPGYTWVCEQTDETLFVSTPAHTNNETEYLAIISALRYFGADHDRLVIYSDSQLVVSQINGSYKTRDTRMRRLKREVLRTKKPCHKIQWIPRKQNVAGHMLETHVFKKRPASRIDGYEATKQTTLF